MSAAAPVCLAIVPYREQPAVKSRLAAELSAAQRLALARLLLVRVLQALSGSQSVAGVLLVGDSPAPAPFAADPRVQPLQSAALLNAAVTEACALAAARGATEVLIAHGDLPLLTAADVDAFIRQGRAQSGVRRAALASCQRHDGTSLLWLSPAEAIEFQYGPGSYARHRERLVAAGYVVAEAPAVADIDSAADLRELLPGLWRESA
jgi:2-phospho-L-lactate guanylyltransferase